MNQNENNGHQTSPTSRREFLKTSSAAALGGVLAANVVFPEKSFAANNDKIKIGLIGCGGRGNGAAADALAADSNTVLYATVVESVHHAYTGSLKAAPMS